MIKQTSHVYGNKMEIKHKFHAGEVALVAPGDKVVLVAPQHVIDLLHDMKFVRDDIHAGSIITVSEVRKRGYGLDDAIWSEEFMADAFLPVKWFEKCEEDETIDVEDISELFNV